MTVSPGQEQYLNIRCYFKINYNTLNRYKNIIKCASVYYRNGGAQLVENCGRAGTNSAL